MPRDLTGCGRYPPQPRYAPFAFYTAVRVGDPEMLARIMKCDPYFVSQDNGAGAPLHFAATYRQLDMVHHLLNLGAPINQRDRSQGWTALHRAARLSHLDGYLEIYEYLLSRGADPSLLTDDYDPYLDPGPKRPIDVVGAPAGTEAGDKARAAILALEARYAGVPKAPAPHADVGDWWALYDYGPETVAAWAPDFVPDYPEERKRARERAERAALRADRAARRAAAYASLAADGYRKPYTPSAVTGTSGSGGAPAALAAAAQSTAETTAAAAASAPLPFDPARPNVFLFPGQGSQAVGMIGRAAAALPAVAEMLATAERVLGYDLLEAIEKGPKERLDATAVAQPALLVAGLAAAAALDAKDPTAAARAGAAAGLSLGEYCSLVWAGALSFEDALRVVKVRGEAMAEAAAACAAAGRPAGMLSVVGLDDAALAAVVGAARAAGAPGTVCEVANYLFPTGRVVSGHYDALDRVAASALAAGALKAARLPVSGAFHTSLMAPARARLEAALAAATIAPPRVPVVSNVTGLPFPGDSESIRALLARQLVEPVQWQATLEALTAAVPAAPSPAAGAAAGSAAGGAGGGEAGAPAGRRALFELGPGAQIKSMVRRVDGGAWKALVNVSAE